MLKELPEAEFGPGIDFREYSFLQNPRLSKRVTYIYWTNTQFFHIIYAYKWFSFYLVQVKESFLEVQLCSEQSTRCHAANETARSGALRFPKHSTQDTVIYLFLSCYNDFSTDLLYMVKLTIVFMYHSGSDSNQTFTISTLWYYNQENIIRFVFVP